MVHLKRWTRFFETVPVGPNRSIEFGPKFPEILVEWIAPLNVLLPQLFPECPWVYISLESRPVRAIRVTRGGLEPSAIARGLAKNGKKVPDRPEKVPDNFSTKILCFLRRARNISDS